MSKELLISVAPSSYTPPRKPRLASTLLLLSIPLLLFLLHLERVPAEEPPVDWWCSSDVAPSPYDYIPIPTTKRVLFLTDYRDYLERMNTHTYEIVDAAIRYPGLQVDVWGPHWKGYDMDAMLSENVKARGEFDLVWTISDIFRPDDPHLDALDMLVQQLGDCHEHRCKGDWYHQNNITLSKYAFELPELFNYEAIKDVHKMGIFGHSPDTANPWDFYPIPWENKTTDATMFGFDSAFYPIRTTIMSAESWITRQPHPGYWIWGEDTQLDTYIPGDPSYAAHVANREEFARGMREARICVFDASLERKMIRKYAQALMSGCVVAADYPTEQKALEGFVIRLDPDWSLARIEEELKKYLEHPEKLQEMARDGMIFARRHLTTTRKVAEVLAMVDAYREGERGYICESDKSELISSPRFLVGLQEVLARG